VIREFLLSTANSDEDESDESSPGVLRVSLVGDDAHLTWENQAKPGAETAGNRPASCSFRVPARSLLLALRAAWDDEHPGATDIDRTRQVRDRRSGPANSHQPWTPELNAQLRDTWLAAEPPASARISEIAQAMGRSRNAIRSRLARIGCDPDVPGRLLGRGSTTIAPGADDTDDELAPA
jgi:hypothetical protein